MSGSYLDTISELILDKVLFFTLTFSKLFLEAESPLKIEKKKSSIFIICIESETNFRNTLESVSVFVTC